MTAPYAFIVCNKESHALVKAEVESKTPEARFAFSRPGLLTFRLPEHVTPETFTKELIFARVKGASLGRVESIEQALALGPPDACVHIFPRDPEDAESRARVETLRGELIARGREVGAPEVERNVLDIVVHEGEPLFVGLHKHTRGCWSVPGGLPDLPVPPESPSRAYAKLEEALSFSEQHLQAGQQAVELGSAPGGATLAMLKQGVRVTAVDPGEMDANVLAFVGPQGARATHLMKPAGAVQKADVPKDAQLLVSDMNLAPPVALRYVKRVRAMMPKLKLAILTLKLNDKHAMARIPTWVDEVKTLGLPTVVATQLPANRQEMVVVAHR